MLLMALGSVRTSFSSGEMAGAIAKIKGLVPEDERKAAREQGINVVSSDKFTVGSAPLPNYIRLSLSGANDLKEFKKGLDILLQVLHSKRGGERSML